MQAPSGMDLWGYGFYYRPWGIIKNGGFMRTIDEVLDRARAVQKVGSDYKLALTLGIGESALANYRNKRSLPDAKACLKLAKAMGEDPDLLVVEMEAQRAKTDEARNVWLRVAQRLQMGFAGVAMMLVIAMVSIAAIALPVSAALYLLVNAVVASVYYVKQWIARILSRFAYRSFNHVNLCKGSFHALFYLLFPRPRLA
jgi:hypothetical protein